MEIFGLAIAILFHHAFSLLLMVVFFKSNAELKEAFIPFDRECLSFFHEYVSIGFPNILMFIASWWSLEVMVLVSGTIGVVEQAAQVILSNMSEINFSIGYGIQSTSCTLVGNEIGKGDLVGSKIMKSFVIKASMAIFVIETLGFYLVKQNFLEVMTDQPHIMEASTPILTMLTINCFLELVGQSMIRGILKAMNKSIAVVKFISYQLFLNCFLLWVCVGDLGYGLKGIWYAKLISEVFMIVATAIVMETSDMEAIIKESNQRILNNNMK